MGKSILVVDDSTSMREMISFTLSDAGFQITEAEDGVDALSKAEGRTLDMVITDLNMPNMNGLELIRALRQKGETKFTPIIMLTTESEAAKKQEGRDAGANGWVVKPFKPEQLVMVVNKVLG